MGTKTTDALANEDGLALLVAVKMTVSRPLTVEGAVYIPLFKVPTWGVMDQVTDVLLVPVTFAVKELDSPGVSVTEPGTIVTLTGVTFAGVVGIKVMDELAVNDELVGLVAIRVTLVCVVTDAGAV
jgi:hypothetical protein